MRPDHGKARQARPQEWGAPSYESHRSGTETRPDESRPSAWKGADKKTCEELLLARKERIYRQDYRRIAEDCLTSQRTLFVFAP